MQKQFIVVAYDISDDRRRARLHDLLEDYGSPVQQRRLDEASVQNVC